MPITVLPLEFYLELSQQRIVGAGLTWTGGMRGTHLPSCCIFPLQHWWGFDST